MTGDQMAIFLVHCVENKSRWKVDIAQRAYAVIPGPPDSVLTEKSLKKSGSLSSSSLTYDSVSVALGVHERELTMSRPPTSSPRV